MGIVCEVHFLVKEECHVPSDTIGCQGAAGQVTLTFNKTSKEWALKTVLNAPAPFFFTQTPTSPSPS
jgi:hypothetical protein